MDNHPPRPPRLLEALSQRLRDMHYSLRTDQAYGHWVREFVRWAGLRHPRDLGAQEVVGFLTMLAAERHVSAATHRQALRALLFLYREVLGVDRPWMSEVGRPVPPRRLPVVLTHGEVHALLPQMDGVTGLLARLLYGTGMLLMAGVRLRIQDVDFVRRVIIVSDGKGGKDRVVMMPRALEEPLRVQLDAARRHGLSDRAHADTNAGVHNRGLSQAAAALAVFHSRMPASDHARYDDDAMPTPPRPPYPVREPAPDYLPCLHSVFPPTPSSTAAAISAS